MDGDVLDDAAGRGDGETRRPCCLHGGRPPRRDAGSSAERRRHERGADDVRNRLSCAAVVMRGTSGRRAGGGGRGALVGGAPGIARPHCALRDQRRRHGGMGGGVIGRAPGSWWMGAGSARARSGGAFEIPNLTSRMVNPYTKGVRRRDSSRHSSHRRRLSRSFRAASAANFFLCSSVGFWSFSCSCRDFSQAKSFE